MNAKETIIFAALKEHPGQAYVTADGKELYAQTEGGMVCWTGPNFNELTDDEINEYIVASLTVEFPQ